MQPRRDSAANPLARANGPSEARLAALAGRAILLALLLLAGAAVAASAAIAKPNVLLVTTDDQTLDEMAAMPYTSSWIGGQGTTFDRAYVSYPLCCPSRASILSGRYMHNHGVRGNGGDFGGWQAFVGGGTEASALPTWLRAAGYYNVQIGKYMNGYNSVVPPGWDEWYGKQSEFNIAYYGARLYYNYRLLEDPPVGPPQAEETCPHPNPNPPGEPFICHYTQRGSDYQTDVFRAKAVDAIHRLSGTGQPFFLKVDFNAPHSPYVPAARHQAAAAGIELEEIPGGNEKNIDDKPRFLRRLPRMDNGKRERIEWDRQLRWAMLFSVDEAVDAMMRALLAENQLQNTYVIFTSDNGYFHGEHRIRSGKYLPHEPSSHVPLLMRGPGIPPNGHSQELVSNVDIADTIRQVAGASASLPQDGRTLLPFAAQPDLSTTRPLLLEGDTGPGVDTGEGEEEDIADERKLKRFRKQLKKQKRELRRRCKRLKRESPTRALLCFKRGVRNLEQEPTDSKYRVRAPAYRSLRTDRYLLTLYSTGEIELYDMRRDSHQLHSLHDRRRYKPIRKWMLKRLNETATCVGASCSSQIDPEPAKKKNKKKKKK